MEYLTFRAEPTLSGDTLSGVVHVFGSVSQSVQHGTRHRFEAGAFDKSIARGKVFGFYAHDHTKPLARPSLAVIDGKLRYSMELGHQSYAEDLRENMAAGLMNEMSFGVSSRKSHTERDADGGIVTVHTVAELVEVSPVVMGDFTGTGSTLHALGVEDRRREMARARFRVAEEMTR